MSRTAWLLALVCAAPLDVVSAQALLVLLFGDKFASENVQGGIKFDVVGTTLSDLSGAERLRSWDLGGFLEVKLNTRLSVQPEFTFKVPAGAQSLPFVPTGAPAVDSAFAAASNVSVTRRLGYIAVPLLLKVKAGRFHFAAGPQIGYVVKAEDHYIGTVTRTDDLYRQLGGEPDFPLRGIPPPMGTPPAAPVCSRLRPTSPTGTGRSPTGWTATAS